MSARPLLALVAAAVLGCRTSSAPPPPAEPAVRELPVQEPRVDEVAPAERRLPADWRERGAWDFEAYVATLERAPWTAGSRFVLAAALDEQDAGSVRAALLLAWGADASRELLLAHLESRQPQPRRADDAAEVVAAAALGRWGDPALAAPLARLAAGTPPHPDLEVRVECAAAALDLGETSVVPFLLRVLHAGTPAELEDPGDWPPTETLAWAKSRAAEALSRRAGHPSRFRPDGSFAHQMEEADALARELGVTP